MVNSTILNDNNASKTTKEPLNMEKPRDNLRKCRKKVEVKPTDNNQQVLKKSTSKSSSNKKGKKPHLNKNKQEQGKIKNNAKENENKCLNESNHLIILSDSETLINKKNCVVKVNKCEIVSPNHKLTEYFSQLTVNIDENSTEQGNPKEIKNDKDASKSNVTNSKQLFSNDILQTSRKKVRKRQSNIELTNHKVTEYFHVRRSERKYKKNAIEEKQKDLENKIINEIEDGLKVKEFEGKGRGVVTTKEFHKGDFVVEYVGDLINGATAKQRELQYAKNKNIGCYMYYFKHKNSQYCIDATKESGKLGRLVNHSRKGNLVSKIIEISHIPHLVLFAKTDIPIDTEILYDYGDRSRESLKSHPWLTL